MGLKHFVTMGGGIVKDKTLDMLKDSPTVNAAVESVNEMKDVNSNSETARSHTILRLPLNSMIL